MPRRHVYPFKLTWEDKHYRKTLNKLNSKQQKKLLKEIAALIKALSNCTHPTSDPILQRWNPSPYKRVIKQSGLYEYRLDKMTRVIACLIEVNPDDEADPNDDNEVDEVVLMLTVTLTHDHERMRRLIQSQKGSISTWTPED